ncbi:MAG: hypothetical protein AB7P00_10990 [Sandaracinaceae bacterium]
MGGEDAWAEELAREYLEKAHEAAPSQPDTLDPLTRHVPREPSRVGSLLDVVPKNAPGTLPSPAPASPPITSPPSSALESTQAGYRGPQRRRTRRPRRAYDGKRLEKVREGLFRAHGQVADVPDLPPLRPEIRGMNLQVMRDGTGRKARELVARLPIGQQMAIYRLAYAALPRVRAGTACAFSREELATAEPLPEAPADLAAALATVRDEVAPSEWFRRIACAAWGMWTHRGRALSEKARKAARGGVFLIEGFCANALSWLVPRADGTPYSRSVLWGPNGPFALLGAAARPLGRKVLGEAGVGLWTRWQPPVGTARFKGPTRRNPKTGQLERFALAQGRYDEPMSGRTAASLARRAHGALRALARTIVEAMTPWVELPAERKRKGTKAAEVAVEPPSAESPNAVREARAPP